MKEKTTKEKKVMIDVQNVTKEYVTSHVTTKVLKGISFKIYEGEFVGIIGPSGSGKSTTLHQLGLLDLPTSGKIFIDGSEVTILTEDERTEFRLRKLGYVFQQYRNIPELTSLENVYLPMRMMGVPKEEYVKEALNLLNEVGLGDRTDHHPYELSGGQQQRVALARALAHKPVILFADEPTANLDTGAGDVVLNLLKKFNKEFNQTIVMVSHEPSHIKYFDRVIRIKDGLVGNNS